MPATLTQLNARLDVLKTALGAGVLSVQHGDVRVQYRSVAELQSAISSIEGDIALVGGSVPLRSIKLTSSKDL